MRQVREAGIDPNNVLLEIIESEVRNTRALLEFIELYREQGFLIAIDDIGIGHSNLERVASVRPDVIKLDRSLVRDIDHSFYKREVARSLVTLGSQTGALIIAEGVEREEEAIRLLDLGVDVFQGYLFARPGPLDLDSKDALVVVHRLGEAFEKHRMDRIRTRRRRDERWEAILRELLAALERGGTVGEKEILAGHLTRYPEIECLYILDETGRQCGETVCNPFRIAKHKRFIYQPAEHGADHSLKDYFLPLKAGLDRYTTEAYVSLASGNLCTTIAARYAIGANLTRILCMDIACVGEASCTDCSA